MLQKSFCAASKIRVKWNRATRNRVSRGIPVIHFGKKPSKHSNFFSHFPAVLKQLRNTSYMDFEFILGWLNLDLKVMKFINKPRSFHHGSTWSVLIFTWTIYSKRDYSITENAEVQADAIIKAKPKTLYWKNLGFYTILYWSKIFVFVVKFLFGFFDY